MARCTDPTCWPIPHEYADHIAPSPRVRRWLDKGTLPKPKAEKPEGLGL